MAAYRFKQGSITLTLNDPPKTVHVEYTLEKSNDRGETWFDLTPPQAVDVEYTRNVSRMEEQIFDHAVTVAKGDDAQDELFQQVISRLENKIVLTELIVLGEPLGGRE